MSALIIATTFGHGSAAAEEKQLTHAPHGHVLTNINAWSPDGRWIVYDVRTNDDFTGTVIEQVNASTGDVQRLYESKNGAACGVVTYSPVDPRVVFIHGPEHPTPDWQYGFSHRRGMLVDATKPGIARPLDAMNYAPPFTPGALRGGSHVHVFSPDGQWVSFTYEDEILAQSKIPAPDREPNQRNVGVAVPAGPVRVAASHPRNNDGDYFSVLVSRTVARPRPGSDEIGRAFEEGWVGRAGYVRNDGTRQKRALAFQGLVTAADGREFPEVFIVDLPDDVTQSGEAPLEGTMTQRPAPPRGVTQRRLTFTAGRKFPGVAAVPRHWLRASPDGTQIAFLMKDDVGVVQLWTISPTGGKPRQVSHHAADIASAISWSPDGKGIAHVMDGSVCVTDLATGEASRLTAKLPAANAPLPLACVYSPDGRQIAFTRVALRTEKGAGFAQVFTVPVPSP